MLLFTTNRMTRKVPATARDRIVGDPLGPSLRRNFSWTLLGNVVFAGCQWGMLMVLAKLGDPEMVGRFALGLAITAPVFMLTNLQLRAVQATDASRDFAFREYLSLRLITTGIAIVVIGAVVFIGWLGTETAWVILGVALAKALDSISDVYYGRLQGDERMDRIAHSLLIKGPLSLTLFGAGVAFTGELAWGAAGLALASALVLVSYDIPTNLSTILPATIEDRRLPPGGRSRRLLRLAWITLPMGAVMMLISFGANIPRYFIEQRLGEKELGFFAAIGYLTVAGTSVVSSLGQATMPRLARTFADGQTREFRTCIARLIGISSLGGAIVIGLVAVGGRAILGRLYTPDYSGHTGVFLGLTIAAVVGSAASILGHAMTAARRFWSQAPLFVGVVLVSSILCSVLIPRLGLAGAAISSIAAALTQLIGSYMIVHDALNTKRGAIPCRADRA